MHFVFLILVVLDQITKAFFSSRDFFVLGLHLHPVKNLALPFGLDFGTLWNFVTLFFVYIIAGWFVIKLGKKSFWLSFGKSMFLAGAASNLADRLIYGYVRDFIDISLGFVFNLADIFIVVGLIMLVAIPVEKEPNVENFPPTSKT